MSNGSGTSGGGSGGTAKQTGPSAATTVVRLQPVSYRLTLIYLGHDRIARAATGGGGAVDRPPPYRCRYEVSGDLIDPWSGQPSPMGQLARILNVVAPDETHQDTVKAATPVSQGGTNARPIFDTLHRITILDNHATRTAENLNLLGSPGGDNTSNVAYYRARGWMPDIWPAVPFRIIVRKYIGDRQVNIDQPIKPVLEIKDPPEELTQNDGARRRFLNDFFTKYNRNTGSVTTGDDNAPTAFKGARTHPGDSPGFKASDVIRVMPYKNEPVVDRSDTPIPADRVQFDELTNPSEHQTVKVRFDLTEVDERVGTTDVKVGVADFAFMPFPVAGDNYRFLLTLLNGDQDIRDTRENGANVIFKDDRSRVIPKPRAYVTGKFTIWKKIEFRLCVLCNGLTRNDLTWSQVTESYRRMFIEVVEPATFYSLTRDQWRDITRNSVFNGAPGVNQAIRYEQSVFDRTLFHENFGLDIPDSRVERFARAAIRLACSQTPAPGGGTLPDPSAGAARDQQSDGNGLYMFLCRDARSFLGAYVGDRIFWMAKRQFQPTDALDIEDVTFTAAHEFGHVKSLRHSHTATRAVNFTDAGGNAYVLQVSHPNNGNVFPIDHDGRDAFECIMSYSATSMTNNDSTMAGPCGLCALSMRFYDRVEIQKAANYRNEIQRTYGPASFVLHTGTGAALALAEQAAGATITLRLGNAAQRSAELLVLGAEQSISRLGGTPLRCRPNIILLGGTTIASQFTRTADPSTPNARVDLAFRGSGTPLLRVRVTATARGLVTLTFRNGLDPTASIRIQVDP